MPRGVILLLLFCVWPALILAAQAVSTKDKEPSGQDRKPCVSTDIAKEVLRLGRSLGYPDEEIVKTYGDNPCAAVDRLRQEARSSPTKDSPNTFRTPAEATQEIEILKGKAWLSFDPKKWKEGKSAVSGKRHFDHVNGDGYAMVIFERIQVPIDELREIALSNARAAAPDIKLVEEQRRRVNGTDLLLLRLEGHAKGIPFTYLGYYYGGVVGTIQVVTYTGQNLFDEYRKDFEDFLNGLRVQQ